MKIHEFLVDIFPDLWQNRIIFHRELRKIWIGIFVHMAIQGGYTMQKGGILKELRKDRKMTQEDIAALLKTSRQYYSDYECEKYELPLHHLEFLSDFFHVSTDYLLGKTPFKLPYKKQIHTT